MENACIECIAYKIHHNLMEPIICPDCGQQTFKWFQDNYGTFGIECSNCLSIAAVQLNTPCQQDPIFEQRVQLVVEPLADNPDNKVVLHLARYFHTNVLEMREKLLHGFSYEEATDLLEKDKTVFETYNIPCRLQYPMDPREKYLYYKECKYPYSNMKVYLNNN